MKTISFDALAKACRSAAERKDKLVAANTKRINELQRQKEELRNKQREAEYELQQQLNTEWAKLLSLVEPENREAGDELHINHANQLRLYRMERLNRGRKVWRIHAVGLGFRDIADPSEIVCALRRCFETATPGKAWIVPAAEGE